MTDPRVFRVEPRSRVPLVEVGDRIALELADRLRARVVVDDSGRITVSRAVAERLVRLATGPEVRA